LYASWDSNLKNVLPDYYEEVCGVSQDEKCCGSGAKEAWDFASCPMDAVVINLGTNDGSAMKSGNFDKDEFLNGFKAKALDFLKKIRKKNPGCIIVWAYGMLGNDMEAYIKEILEEYIKLDGDDRAYFLKLENCTGKELGARSHPTPEAHLKEAGILAGFLKEKFENKSRG